MPTYGRIPSKSGERPWKNLHVPQVPAVSCGILETLCDAVGLGVRDPIHGMIEYNKTEEAIMNSRLLQRLRGIRQLTLCE